MPPARRPMAKGSSASRRKLTQAEDQNAFAWPDRPRKGKTLRNRGARGVVQLSLLGSKDDLMTTVPAGIPELGDVFRRRSFAEFDMVDLSPVGASS